MGLNLQFSRFWFAFQCWFRANFTQCLNWGPKTSQLCLVLFVNTGKKNSNSLSVSLCLRKTKSKQSSIPRKRLLQILKKAERGSHAVHRHTHTGDLLPLVCRNTSCRDTSHNLFLKPVKQSKVSIPPSKASVLVIWKHHSGAAAAMLIALAPVKFEAYCKLSVAKSIHQ